MKKDSGFWNPVGPKDPISEQARPAPADELEIFTVESLRMRAQAAVPVPKSEDDNSGLIDIKALLAEAERASEPKALDVSANLPVYPFGTPCDTPTPVVVPEVAASAPGSPRSARAPRAWLSGAGFFAAGVGIAALAAAAVMASGVTTQSPRVAMSSLTAAAVHAAAPPLMQPVKEQDQAFLASMKQPATEAAEPLEVRATTARTPRVTPHVSKAPVMNRPKAETATAQNQAPKKPSRSDSCNGDLMCAMQRAVRK